MQYNKKELTTFSNILAVGSRGLWEPDNNFLSFIFENIWVGRFALRILEVENVFTLKNFSFNYQYTAFKLQDPFSIMNKGSDAVLNTVLLNGHIIF